MIDDTVKILLQTGAINPQQLQVALEEQLITNENITKVLIKKGFITEAKINDTVELYEIGDINIETLRISPDVIRMIPLHIIKNNKVFPLRFESNKFVLAMTNPKDLITRDTVTLLLGKSITLQKYPITQNEYKYLMEKYSNLLGNLRDKPVTQHSNEYLNLGHLDIKENDIENVEVLIPTIFENAIKKEASQITIEPIIESVRIRFRIDDVFYEEARLPRKMYQNVLTYVKSLAGLQGEEKSFYYNGTFKFTTKNKKEINFVINGIKTINGDKLTLKPGYDIPSLKNLFYYPEPYEYLEKTMSKNKGLILVIGGSGSGKTTTMYSILQHKISNRHQLMTLEENVKYAFENYVTQIQVKEDKINDLENFIYEVSHHNPDILMIQDIKNESWASLIEELALSGTLILTGMRAYNILSGLKRLKRMNFPNFSSFQTIINQKLLRKLCPDCKLKDHESIKKLSSSNNEQIHIYMANPNGCEDCIGGYKGIIGIFEVVKVTKELVDVLNENKFLGAETGKIIDSSSIINFKEYSRRLLKDGIISIEEYNRVM